jgi:Tfp pilus assembly protein PilV
MTLLEALAALVILGTTAVGFLEVFHATARTTRDAGDWAGITAYAESVMERTKLDAPATDATVVDPPRGASAQVETRPWAPGVSEVVVVVTSATGQRLELHRLTREALPGTPPTAGGRRP